MKPFEPKGDRPEWQLIYEKVSTLDEGVVLAYDDLDELLGRDFRAYRSPIYRCVQEMETADHRTLMAVRGAGYRIAAANEHAGLAVGHHKRSRKQMRKAVSKATSADRSKLTTEERKRIDGLEMSLRQHSDMIRRLEVRDEQRQAEIKTLRRETTEDVAGLSDRVDRLAALLERHGVDGKQPKTAA